MKKCLTIMSSVFIAVSIAGTAGATLINGGFESESPVGDGWTTGGNVFFSPFTVTLMPTEGTRFVQLNNGYPVNAPPPTSADVLGGPSGTEIGAALGTSAPPILSAVEGSYIYQDFFVTAGSTISFDYLFLTDEDRDSFWNDRALVTLSYSFGSSAYGVADTFSTLVASTIGGYDLMTGTQSFSFDAHDSGNARLGFVITDVGNAYYQSSLYLDNVSVTEPIPEPATMLLFGTGIAGLTGLRLRRKKK